MPVVDVGMPPNGVQGWGWDTHIVRFHDFAKLPKQKGGDGIQSPEFTCAGHSWALQIHPGGWKASDDGMVAMYLFHQGRGGVKKIEFSFHVKDENHEARAWRSPRTSTDLVPDEGVGYSNFAKRTSLLKACIGTTLVVEVRMKVLEQESFFVPKNPAAPLLKHFVEPSDVTFEVDRELVGRKTRSSFDALHYKLYAHKLVVEEYAPGLDIGSAPSAAQVSVPDVKPEVFANVLLYMYGVNMPDTDLKDHSKELVEAAQRFGMTHLKLTAEAWYVQKAQINNDTLEEHLLFAGDNRLALLKEAAVDFIIESGFEIEELKQKAQKGLAGDIQRATTKTAGDKFGKMRVNELRKRLEEKGLDIGGSKKQMIDALREAATSDEVTVCAANLGKMKV